MPSCILIDFILDCGLLMYLMKLALLLIYCLLIANSGGEENLAHLPISGSATPSCSKLSGFLFCNCRFYTCLTKECLSLFSAEQSWAYEFFLLFALEVRLLKLL